MKAKRFWAPGRRKTPQTDALNEAEIANSPEDAAVVGEVTEANGKQMTAPRGTQIRFANAADRQAWINSPERSRLLHVVRQWFFASLFVALLVGTAVTFMKWTENSADCGGMSVLTDGLAVNCQRRILLLSMQEGLLYAGITAVVVILLCAYTAYFWRLSLRRHMQDRVELDEARDKLRSTEQAVYPRDHEVPGEAEGNSELKLSLLWNATHERLNIYHQIATEQAKYSFRRAQAAMVSGFMVVTLSLVLAMLSNDVSGSVVVGALGIAAGALSAFISQTFLRSQETAAEHLRAYFLQPLEFSRYLVAERLLNTLSEEKKSEGILLIVQGIATFAGPAEKAQGSKQPHP